MSIFHENHENFNMKQQTWKIHKRAKPSQFFLIFMDVARPIDVKIKAHREKFWKRERVGKNIKKTRGVLGKIVSAFLAISPCFFVLLRFSSISEFLYLHARLKCIQNLLNLFSHENSKFISFHFSSYSHENLDLHWQNVLRTILVFMYTCMNIYVVWVFEWQYGRPYFTMAVCIYTCVFVVSWLVGVCVCVWYRLCTCVRWMEWMIHVYSKSAHSILYIHAHVLHLIYLQILHTYVRAVCAYVTASTSCRENNIQWTYRISTYISSVSHE